MSGFDENPFGEPTINDPFSDPAIRRAVNSTPVNRGLEDYNPFAEPNTTGPGQQVRGAANPPAYGEIGTTQQPATLQPSNQDPPPPTYTRTSQQNVNAPLGNTISPPSNQRADDQFRVGARDPSYYPKRNNWPPLPDNCCFQPCFYQDIDVEIHTDFQKIVRQLYNLWMFHCLVLILNILGGFILIFVDKDFTTFGLGIVFLVIFTPSSFICWYRPAYKAFRNDSSFNFMVFFFMFFFQFVVTSIQAVGIPGTGVCGLIRAVTAFSDKSASSIFAGIILLLIAFCFVAAAVGDLLLITKIHQIYRRSDASVSKAQQEFATTFLRNEHVQSAASNVAASAVRHQMSNASQPRY